MKNLRDSNIYPGVDSHPLMETVRMTETCVSDGSGTLLFRPA